MPRPVTDSEKNEWRQVAADIAIAAASASGAQQSAESLINILENTYNKLIELVATDFDKVKEARLRMAVDIAKAAASGGYQNGASLTKILESTYKKLIELA